MSREAVDSSFSSLKDLQGIPAAGHPVAVFVTAAGKNNPFLVSQIYSTRKD